MRIYRTNHLYGKDGITGYGRTRFFRALKDGEFPPPNVNLRNGPIPIHGWTDDLVSSWVENKRNDNPVTKP